MNLTKDQRQELRMKYSGYCSYCGNRLTDKWHADHLEPVQREGKWVPSGYRRMEYVQTGIGRPERDTLTNLMPSCVPCNVHKSDLPLEQWRRTLEHAHRTLHDNYSTYRHALRFKRIVETTTPLVFYFERHGLLQRREPTA